MEFSLSSDSFSGSEKENFRSFLESLQGEDDSLLNNATKEQLLEEITFLTKENQRLKAHFDQACQNASNSTQLSKQNETLKMDLLKANSQIDDLKQKVQILSVSQKDLMSKIEKDKEENECARNNDLINVQTEFEKTQKAFCKKIKDLSKELSEANKKIDEYETNDQITKHKYQKLFINLRKVFPEQSFSSFDDFYTFMEAYSPKYQEITQKDEVYKPREINKMNQQQSDFEKLEKKLLKKKFQNKQIEAQNKQLAITIDNVRKENEKLKATIKVNEKDAKDNESKFKKVEEEYESNIEDQNKQIKLLEKQNETYKNQISKLQQTLQQKEFEKQQNKQNFEFITSQNQHITDQTNYFATPLIHKTVPQAQNDSPNKNINKQFRRRMEEITFNLQRQNQKNKELEKEIQSLKDREADLNSTLSKCEHEKESLTTVYNEMEKERNILRKTIETKDKQFKEAAAASRKTIKNQTAQIQLLEASNEDMKKEILKLNTKISSLQHESNELKQKESKYESSIEEMTENITSLKEELQSFKHENDILKKQREEEMIKAKEENERLIPLHFPNEDFDSNLQNELLLISQNSSLQNESKVQRIISSICNFYKQKISEKEKENKENESDIQKISAKMDDFIVSLTIALYEQPLTLHDFLSSQENGERIIREISILQQNLNNLSQENNTLNDYIHMAEDLFPYDCDSFPALMQNVHNNFVQLCRVMKQYKKETKQLKKVLKQIIDQNEDERNINSQKISELEVLNERINQENEKQKAQIKLMKKENQKLQHRSIDLQQIEAENMSKAQETLEIAKNEHENQIQNLTQQFTQKLHEMQNEYDLLKQENDEIQSKLADVEEQNQKYKQYNKDMEGKIVSLEQKCQQQLQNMRNQCENEKENMKNNCEVTVSNLSKQCEKYRNDITLCNEKIMKIESKFNESKQTIAKNNQEIIRMKKEIKNLEEEKDRERQLAEISANNKIAAIETKYKATINGLKAQLQSNVRTQQSIPF